MNNLATFILAEDLVSNGLGEHVIFPYVLGGPHESGAHFVEGEEGPCVPILG